MKNILFIIIAVLFLTSCEDVIELNVQDGVEQLVVDGWLTNNGQDQVIKLSLSQPYFDQTTPNPAVNAEVIVLDADGTPHVFLDHNNSGEYILPKDEAAFLSKEGNYSLSINYEGETYAAISELKRVPKIDSIDYTAFSFPITPPDSGPKDGFIASFYSVDPVGFNDTYWIRTSKNGELFNNPANIAIAYDAGFTSGSNSDGILFIPPIRQSINDGLYIHGDTISVELWSITLDAYYYLNQVRIESSDGGIFSTPPANIYSNVFNLNESSAKTALGFFGVSAISEFSTVVDSTKAVLEE